jgi:2-iminobutanoate/2-iminopropanoate deaminase
MSAHQKRVVNAPKAPKPIGPYSVGIHAGCFLYTAGMAGVDPASGKLVAGGIEAETRQTLTNLAAILEAGGSSIAQVVKTTVFLQDIADFPAMNAIYAELFSAEPPARSTVQVAALPLGAKVEIEAVAIMTEHQA